MKRAGREIIEACRTSFGPAPRPLPGDLRARAPLWLRSRPRDELWRVVRDHDALLTHGTVVWGSVVQAHRALLRPGRGDRPAVVVYSPDPAFDDMPDELQDIASALFAVKGTAPGDPGLAAFATVLADERRRVARLAVPRGLVGSLPAFATSLLVRRRHLPGGYLGAGTFPLVVRPERPGALVLPGRFWPDRLLGLWRSAARSG
ncbi:hypothetical protein [Actinomadura rayongensis]|uniref:Uncharacterized protein n=1 Tax=Actinomadura rayongensis TaxID=1429076 RepID=A0A6I4WJM8_9ACTN|nr:hypothetical protein [Actinomadura rayongensis]MXQ66802.1 hypothetical protein [Actinomadura rayongensis]